MILGVTGRYCAGKNSFVGLIAADVVHIDVDKTGHQALSSQRDRLVARFGATILDAAGAVDRRALGRLVFADSAALSDLETIVHPSMRQIVGDRVAAERRRLEAGEVDDLRVVINAALLFRMQLYHLCDRIVWVDAPWLLRVRRAMRRDGLGLSAVLARFARQRDLNLRDIRTQLSAAAVDTRHEGRPTIDRIVNCNRATFERRARALLASYGLARTGRVST